MDEIEKYEYIETTRNKRTAWNIKFVAWLQGRKVKIVKKQNKYLIYARII